MHLSQEKDYSEKFIQYRSIKYSSARLLYIKIKWIFFDTWDLLKPGSHLIYSTCTFNPEENENNLAYCIQILNFDLLEIPFPEYWKIYSVKRVGFSVSIFIPTTSNVKPFLVSCSEKIYNISKNGFLQKGKDSFFTHQQD
ncbi:MAG: hypothetical protein ACMUEM_06010 [Flavobacteriales bacterium AspAUS03]